MMIALRHLRRALLVLPLLVLAACNTVGEGNKIETLTVQNFAGNTVSATVPMYRCLRYNFSALGTFTNGSSGYYTSRAVWSSSNPSVAVVSNGDIQLPSNAASAYSYGTVIPVGLGTATISVDYVGIKASFNINVVGSPSSITLLPSTPLIPRPAAGNQTIAPRTLITYTALANVGGRMTDITNVGVWSVVGAGTTAAPTAVDSIAQFVTGFTSSFKGVGAGGPVTIQADFNSVANSCPLTATTQLTVAPMKSLALSSEFGTNPPALIVGTTDRIKAIATLDLGSGSTTTQDISELGVSGDGTTNTVTYLTPTLPSTRAAATPTISTVMGYRFVSPLVNLLLAVAADATQTGSDQTTVDLQAKFVTVPQVTDANGNITTQEVSIKTDPNAPLQRALQTGTLQSINISAGGSTSLTVPSFPQYAEDAERVQLQAIGTYLLSNNRTITQDITRSVTWTSSDSSTVFVYNAGINAAQAGLAVAGRAGAVAVNATFTDASTTPSTITTSNSLTLVAQ